MNVSVFLQEEFDSSSEITYFWGEGVKVPGNTCTLGIAPDGVLYFILARACPHNGKGSSMSSSSRVFGETCYMFDCAYIWMYMYMYVRTRVHVHHMRSLRN
jgi:hypothetical protein